VPNEDSVSQGAIVTPASKKALRRVHDRKRAYTILESLSQGTGDVYEGYRALYGIWRSNNAAVQELRPLFRIPGIEPDGALSVTDEFKKTVRSLAKEILPLVEDEKVGT
jgi:hypothetical protein